MSATFWALNGGKRDDVVVSTIAGSGYPWAIAYGGGTYAACALIGSGGANVPKIYTSSDGVTFNTPTISDLTSESYNNTGRTGIYANSKFVFLASDGSARIVSADSDSGGTTFYLRDTSAAGEGAFSICWDGTRFLGAGGTKLVYSTTGLNDAWSQSTINASFGGRGLCFGNSLYIAVGQTGAIYTSTDRSTWTSRTSGTSDLLYSVEYSSTLGLYCAVGNAGTIITSPDGTTWTTRTAPSGVTYLRNIKWSSSHSKFFAVGAGINYSSDGVNWFKSSYSSTASFYDIAFNGLEAVVTTENSQLAYKSSLGFVF